MRRTCLVLQHVAFEDLGSLAPSLQAMDFDIHYRQAGVDDLTSARASAEWLAADLVVVLGGPIGVYEADRYPCVRDALARLRERLAADRPLLGICLGAQMIAAACGERVYPGPAREIGYQPLQLTPAGLGSPLQALSACGCEVLHWHGDTFDLPPRATLLASTTLVANQIFALGPRVLGLQCHLEGLPGTLERWLIGHTVELTAAAVDLDLLRADHARVAPALQEAAEEVWREWLASALAE